MPGQTSPTQGPSRFEIEQAVRLALAEDIGAGDYTSLWILPAEMRSQAVFLAK